MHDNYECSKNLTNVPEILVNIQLTSHAVLVASTVLNFLGAFLSVKFHRCAFEYDSLKLHPTMSQVLFHIN